MVATAPMSRSAKAIPPPPGPRWALPGTEVAPWQPRAHWSEAGLGHAGPTWQRLKMSSWVTRTLKCLITAFACCWALREQSTARQRPAPSWAWSCGHVQLLSWGVWGTQSLPSPRPPAPSSGVRAGAETPPSAPPPASRP